MKHGFPENEAWFSREARICSEIEGKVMDFGTH